MSMTVKKGDNVVVIAGKDKGKTGRVTEVSPKDGKVLVDGVNIVTKHQKARKQGDKSQIVKKNAPIEASNVMVVCPVCGKATRVAHREIDGKKVRACKKCSASLDKEFVKATKKEAKKNVSAEPKKSTEAKKSTETISGSHARAINIFSPNKSAETITAGNKSKKQFAVPPINDQNSLPQVLSGISKK